MKENLTNLVSRLKKGILFVRKRHFTGKLITTYFENELKT